MGFRSLLLLVFSAAIAGGYRWRVKSIEGRNANWSTSFKNAPQTFKNAQEIEAYTRQMKGFCEMSLIRSSKHLWMYLSRS
jgi:hypothetical protein